MGKTAFENQLYALGLQKAGLERRGISDFHNHCSVRTRTHRRIGKLMQTEIDSGRKRKDVIAESSEFLRAKFPDVRGFSKSSLRNMLNLYNDYKDDPELEKMSDEIPVSQNRVISTLCKTNEERRTVLTSSVFWEL